MFLFFPNSKQSCLFFQHVSSTLYLYTFHFFIFVCRCVCEVNSTVSKLGLFTSMVNQWINNRVDNFTFRDFFSYKTYTNWMLRNFLILDSISNSARFRHHNDKKFTSIYLSRNKFWRLYTSVACISWTEEG